MELLGCKEWNQIFNEHLSKIWQSEKKELQTAAVLFGALQLELNSIQTKIEDQLTNLRRKYDEKEELEQILDKKKLLSTSLNFQQNLEASETILKNKPLLRKKNRKQSDVQSPDLFKANEDLVDDSTIIDLSVTEDEVHTRSPTLNKSKKPYRILKEKSSQDKSTNLSEVKRDIFTNDDDDDDETFIETMTTNHMKNKAKNSDLESGFAKNGNKREQPFPNSTDKLSYKKQKTTVVSAVEPEPVIRGKARKTVMNGTSCKDCQKFYGSMNLPPAELQKLINKCSNHRYVYRPPEETMPGFWDLTFPDE